jgi:NADP-dependent 3-hydroxy acid dehydrogenase YdfG
MSKDLAGRIAVVTGAASGIGAATAELLAARGAAVALLARRKDRLDELAARIGAAGGRAVPVPVDVTDATSVAAAADRVRAELGRPDLVVNNAGVMLAAPIEAGRTGDWQRMIDTNVNGVLRMLHAFLPDLLAAADRDAPADLVNVSSIGAHEIFPEYAVYGATKAAVSYLSAALRAELGPRDVRVTNIEPGLTATELGSHLDEKNQQGLAGMFDSMGGLAAADVADLVGYVVSRPRHVNLRQVIVQPTGQA